MRGTQYISYLVSCFKGVKDVQNLSLKNLKTNVLKIHILKTNVDECR